MISLKYRTFIALVFLGSLIVSGCSSGSTNSTSGVAATNAQVGSGGGGGTSGTPVANGGGGGAPGAPVANGGGGAPGAPVANGGGGGGGGGAGAPGAPIKIPAILVEQQPVPVIIQVLEYGNSSTYPDYISGPAIVDQCPGKTLCVQVVPEVDPDAKVDPKDQGLDQCTTTGETDPAAGGTIYAGKHPVIHVLTGALLPCGGSSGGGSPAPGDGSGGSPAPGPS